MFTISETKSYPRQVIASFRKSKKLGIDTFQISPKTDDKEITYLKLKV